MSNASKLAAAGQLLDAPAGDPNFVLKGAASVLTAPSRPFYTNNQTITATGTFVFDPTNGQVQRITCTTVATITMGAPTNIVEGTMYEIIFVAGDTSARTIAWNSAYKWPSAAPLLTSLSVTSGGRDSITFMGGSSNTLEYKGSQLDVR